MLCSLQNSPDFKDACTFIEAIRANPLANTPRLAFADWLDERQQIAGCAQWAELIRLQCSPAATRSATLPNDVPRSDYIRTSLRIRELMPQVAEMSGLPCSHRSERGFFPRPLQFKAADLAKLQDTIDENPGWLLEVNISHAITSANITTTLAPCPNLRRVTSLHLSNNRLGADGITALEQCTNLSGLASLNLSGNHLQAGGIAALALCTNLSGLASLDLSNNGLNAADITALAQCTNFPNLTQLNLRGNRLHEDDLLPLIHTIAEGILPDGTKGEVFPRLQRLITQDVEIDRLFADAIAARAARLQPPQADVTLAEIQQHSPANEVV